MEKKNLPSHTLKFPAQELKFLSTWGLLHALLHKILFLTIYNFYIIASENFSQIAKEYAPRKQIFTLCVQWNFHRAEVSTWKFPAPLFIITKSSAMSHVLVDRMGYSMVYSKLELEHFIDIISQVIVSRT